MLNLKQNILSFNRKIRLIKSIKISLKLLKMYKNKIILDKETQDNLVHFSRTLIKDGFDFSEKLLKSSLTLSRDQKQSSFATCILMRSFFEVSVRLLWAVRTANGWERVQKYWAIQDKKWANGMISNPAFSKFAQNIISITQPVIDRNSLDLPPSLEIMLKEIRGINITTGLDIENIKNVGLDYNFIYRVLSRIAHGHIEAINIESAHSEDYLKYLIPIPLHITFILIQAMLHTISNDPKNEILNMIPMMKLKLEKLIK